jgi:hypothetical protein
MAEARGFLASPRKAMGASPLCKVKYCTVVSECCSDKVETVDGRCNFKFDLISSDLIHNPTASHAITFTS